MLIAHYIGRHDKDNLRVRAGWALTRLAQRGEFKQATHCEAILQDYGQGVADIASSSLRDGGVRIKERVAMDPDHWLIVDVPSWDVYFARSWFVAHKGMPYDLRGALATVFLGSEDPERAFCSEAVGLANGVHSAATFGPAQFAALTYSFGKDAHTEFFKGR